MITSRFTSPAFGAVFSVLLLAACKEKPQGIVANDASVVAVVADAAPATVDVNSCAGCSLVAQQTWSFQGIYRDEACTDPLAQVATPACANVPALGPATITYTDEVGGRKAGESASVTLSEQVAPDAARFRKTAKGCARANEIATDVTPAGCAGQKVCRDANGTLACTGCRTFANGCPDFEETRTYAAIVDPAVKAAAKAGGGNSLEKLRACCNALAAEGKRLGASPEGGMMTTAASQCSALVTAAGPNGTAPELGAVRGFLQGRNLPAVCAGL